LRSLSYRYQTLKIRVVGAKVPLNGGRYGQWPNRRFFSPPENVG
jgi:hypothetical protein